MKRTYMLGQSLPENSAFIALFALVNAIALLPPVYIALSNQHGLILGLPISVWYLVLVSAAAIAATTGLWVSECRRGVVD